MTTNRLQAFLDKANPAPLPAAPQGGVTTVNQERATEPEVVTGKRTVLVGAHLPPEYNKQLRLIAAEEDSQVNTLIREALDLLFIKKGKARVSA